MILDHFSAETEPFSPNTIAQYTALQILLRFDDQIHQKQYLLAANKHTLSHLIFTYHKAVRSPAPGDEFFKQLSSQK